MQNTLDDYCRYCSQNIQTNDFTHYRVWHNLLSMATKGKQHKIQKYQNRFLRLIFRPERRTTNISLYKRAKLIPIYDRHIIQLMNFKIKFRDDIDKIRIPIRNNRANAGRNFIIRPHKTHKAYNSPYWAGPRNWALLP